MKIPPQNIEAEGSFLSACLIDCREEVADLLEPQDFYEGKHRRIFKAIVKLLKAKQPVDLTTVYTELKEDSEETNGIGQYLAHLVDEVPVAPNLEHYARMIKTASTGRKLITTAQKIQEQAFEITIDNVDKVLDTVQNQIMNVGFDCDDKRTISASDLCLQRISQYEELCKGHSPGIKTGFRSIDMLTGGFFGALFVIIAARPSIGKSALMLNMSKNMASCGHRVGVFSIEMSKEAQIDRLISGLSGINSTRLKTGRIGNSDWKLINEAAEKIYSLPIFFDDAGGLTVQELKRRARKMIKQGVEIIFIDQLSKIRGGEGQKDHEKKAYIVNELASFKKEVQIPIVLLSQINRDGEEKPSLSKLARTGALEEDGDIVLIGHRDYPYTKKPEDEFKANWELAKNRDGATTNISMRWDGKTSTFTEVVKEYDDYQA